MGLTLEVKSEEGVVRESNPHHPVDYCSMMTISGATSRSFSIMFEMWF